MAKTSRIAIATALVLVTTSAAFAESNVIPGERDPNPIAQRPSTPLLQSPSVYDARMQVLNDIRTPAAPAPVPFEKNYFDRASQTVDGGN